MLVTIIICTGSGDELGRRIYRNTNFRYLMELFLTKKVLKCPPAFLIEVKLLSSTFNTFTPYLNKKQVDSQRVHGCTLASWLTEHARVSPSNF